MNVDEKLLSSSEKIALTLRALFAARGFTPYKMSKFEEYDLYAKNKDFLVSDNVITFTDRDGKLMALRPDVTLSIIKNSSDEPQITKKIFYNENVYRVSKSAGTFREIMQAGVECFGKVGEKEVIDTIDLAAESLNAISEDFVLTLSDLDILEEAIKSSGVSPDKEGALYSAVADKNLADIEALSNGNGEILKKLVRLSLNAKEAIAALDELFGSECVSYNKFKAIINKLSEGKFADKIRVDFSITDDSAYYNGIVFKGFLQNAPSAVLTGGRYDKMMKRMKRLSSAIGFAVYTDELELKKDGDFADGYINVALPKGRLGEKAYKIFAEAGFDCPTILEPNRKLIFENPEKKLRFFWVKPSDIAIYVERGAADIGVVGKDILTEYSPDVYELIDLNIGKSKMCVAAPKGFVDDGKGLLRVATKFTNTAEKYYQSKGRSIDVIHLNGSIELAPILNLSDVIFDLVETGKTLKDNDLSVIEVAHEISARLIANKASYKFKGALIDKIAARIDEITE